MQLVFANVNGLIWNDDFVLPFIQIWYNWNNHLLNIHVPFTIMANRHSTVTYVTYYLSDLSTYIDGAIAVYI